MYNSCIIVYLIVVTWNNLIHFQILKLFSRQELHLFILLLFLLIVEDWKWLRSIPLISLSLSLYLTLFYINTHSQYTVNIWMVVIVTKYFKTYGNFGKLIVPKAIIKKLFIWLCCGLYCHHKNCRFFVLRLSVYFSAAISQCTKNNKLEFN